MPAFFLNGKKIHACLHIWDDFAWHSLNDNKPIGLDYAEPGTGTGHEIVVSITRMIL